MFHPASRSVKTGKILRAVLPRLIVYGALILWGCHWARGQFYQPDQTLYGTPESDGIVFEDITFASHDGTLLNGWFVPAAGAASARDAKGTVITMHGNGGNITLFWSLVAWLPQRGFNVFLFDYRGYGRSQGKPTFKGVFEDTLSAIDYVRARTDIDAGKLLIYAQSLGGNNAIAAIGSGNRGGIRAMAIDSTFYSYPAIAHDKVYGAGLIMNDDYSADRFIAALEPIPLLLLHGTADRVVPASHSERLFEKARSPKQLILIPGGEHIDALTDKRYRNLLVSFYENALAEKP